jgi:hypothetical protein
MKNYTSKRARRTELARARRLERKRPFEGLKGLGSGQMLRVEGFAGSQLRGSDEPLKQKLQDYLETK